MALVLENIESFEQTTKIRLSIDDLRIISMNRFSSLERSMNHVLTEFEYRYLLQHHLPLDHIEQELLKRPLTLEERIEQQELTLLPYQKLLPDEVPISSEGIVKSLEEQNITLSQAQLEQVNLKACFLYYTILCGNCIHVLSHHSCC